jgi:Ca2+-binding RTX toxin-like protein
MLFADGSVIAGDILLTALTAELPEVAAGAAGASGGAGEYRDDMGNLIDGVDRLGAQDPDPFAREVELVLDDEQVVVLEELEPPPPPPENLPPQIDTDSGNEGDTPDLVYESGLEPDGTSPSPLTIRAEGTFTVSDPDGLDDIVSITMNGEVFPIGPGGLAALIGEVINGAHGTFELTGYADGEFSYIYTLTEATTDVDGETEFDSLSITVTDSIGQTASRTIWIEIVDDEPTASISAVPDAVVVLDETVGAKAGDANAADDYDVSANPFDPAWGIPIGLMAEVSLVDVTTATGADSAGATTAVTLSIVGGAGTGSGLYTTGGENQIFLYYDGDVVVGRVGDGDSANSDGAVAFALSIDGDGQVTVAQYLSLNHPTAPDSHDEYVTLAGKLNAVVTVTDGDADQANDFVAIGGLIRFEDDGPTAMIDVIEEATATVDESDDADNLDDPFTYGTPLGVTAATLVTTTGSSTGEDEEGATTVVTLAIVGDEGASSGLFTTGNVNEIFLYYDGDFIVGRVGNGNTPDPDGAVAFALAIDNAGEVTVAQYLSLHHPDAPDNHDEPLYLTGKINAIVTITDGDGDQASDSVAIGGLIRFEDDGPSGIFPDSARIEDKASNPSLVEQLNFFAGVDGIGTVEFTLNLDPNTPTMAMDAEGRPLTFEGQQLYLYYGSNGTDKTLLEAKTSEGTVGFFVDIDPVANTYTVHSNGVISNGTATTATDLSGVGGGNVVWKALIDIGGTTEDVMMSTSSGNTVNTNSSEIGISAGNSFEFGEGIRFDFINDLEASKIGPNWNFTYDGTHNETMAWRQVISKVVGTVANITLTAIVADNDNTFYGDQAGETKVELFAKNVKIYDQNDTLIKDLAAAGITINDADEYSLTIYGLKQGYTYEIYSETPFTALQLDAAAGTSTFKLGFFSYGEDSFGAPIDLSYGIAGLDGDGDATYGTIDVAFYPDGYTWTGTAGDDTYHGSSADNVILGADRNDTLYGEGGNDVLAGNSGNDHLYGGVGNDMLYGGSGDDDLYGGPGNDYLDGGSGNDFLVGGEGSDILIGGIGADTFVFSALGGEGADTITDFSIADGDVLLLKDVLGDGDNIFDADDVNVTVTAAENGSDLVLTINGSHGETTVTLTGFIDEYGSTPTLDDLISLNIVQGDGTL